MQEDYTPFFLLIKTISTIPESEWQWLKSNLNKKVYSPGTALFRQGDCDAGVHYLESGLVRYYYLTEEGVERNHTFAAEGNLVGCLPACAGRGVNTFSVEAIERTYTFKIPGPVYLTLDERHPCWLRFKLRLMEHVALRKEAREATFLLDSAEVRYQRFLSDYGEVAERIPQYHIASWLGISPVALSRIRKRINLG